MRRLSVKEIAYLSNEWLKTGECSQDEQDAFRNHLAAIPCTIAFPLGELMNRKLVGYLVVLRNCNTIPKPRPITDKYHFDAQGIEGCLELEQEDLALALTLWREATTPNRLNIFVEGSLEMSDFVANVISVTKVSHALKELLATYLSKKEGKRRNEEKQSREYWDGACQAIEDVATALHISLEATSGEE